MIWKFRSKPYGEEGEDTVIMMHPQGDCKLISDEYDISKLNEPIDKVFEAEIDLVPTDNFSDSGDPDLEPDSSLGMFSSMTSYSFTIFF